MTEIAGRNRVNRPYFFTGIDGQRVEFPSFGEGSGDLGVIELAKFNAVVRDQSITALPAEEIE